MKKIVITGGAGYIGSFLTELLLENNFEVTVVDKLMFNEMSLAKACSYNNFNFVKSDVLDINNYRLELTKADFVIPLAAYVGAPMCKINESYSKKINYEIVSDICNLLSPNQNIIYPNTNSGYGLGQQYELCTEESPLKPLSGYAKWKVESEKKIMDRQNSISFRLATVFGIAPRLRTDLLVNDFVQRAVKDKFIVLFEPHFKRNFIHVRDVGYTFLHAINNMSKMKDNIFNVGLSNANLSKLELCDKIKHYLPNFYVNISDYENDPDKRDYIVSNQKLENTGWVPKFTIEDGIQELIKIYNLLKFNKYGNI